MNSLKSMSLPGLFDFEPAGDHVRQSMLDGLRNLPKKLPSKLLYDERGSELFEEICLLEEYYPTRTEMSIFQTSLKEIAALIGSQATVVELGSGSGKKTSLLLESIEQPFSYIPVEISKQQLIDSSKMLAGIFPNLKILPVCADYTKAFEVPEAAKSGRRTVVFFPGSTIGNFEPEEAVRFLRDMSRLCQPDGGILIGVDLKKDERIIERAYNDVSGVTAAFNLNLLKRIAREFGIDDFSCRFRHKAIYNSEEGRIEMRLISTEQQLVVLDGCRIRFKDGEAVTSEYSYKYTLEDFENLALQAGLEVRQVWTDAKHWFSVQYLTRAEEHLEISQASIG